MARKYTLAHILKPIIGGRHNEPEIFVLPPWNQTISSIIIIMVPLLLLTTFLTLENKLFGK